MFSRNVEIHRRVSELIGKYDTLLEVGQFHYEIRCKGKLANNILQGKGTFTQHILSAETEKPLRSMSVELELVPIQHTPFF